MQVDSSEVLADFEEHFLPGQPADGVREIKLLEDDAGICRKAGNVIFEVLTSLGGSQRLQRILRSVVEGVFRSTPEDEVQVDAALLVLFVSFQHRFTGGFKHALQPSQQCKWQDNLAEIRVLEIPPKVLGVLPNEIRQGCIPVAVPCH